MDKIKEVWHDKHHLYEGIFWALLTIPTMIWWQESVLWVALMSLYNNYKTAIGAHEGRQARRNTEKEGT